MTTARKNSAPPFSILIAALGGEGGSVLLGWLVAAARAQGLAVQATSVPGVAQRTGSTSYYLECAPRLGPERWGPDAIEPIFALVPMAGRVDVVIASEAVEAGRMMERGFVSPERTTLIYSTSRELTIAEKIALTDGRYDYTRVDRAAQQLAARVIADDFNAMAEAHGTMVNATLFGAAMASRVLPWSVDIARTVIGTDGRAKASLRGFDAAVARVSAFQSSDAILAPQTTEPPNRLSGLDQVVAAGEARCLDYQDAAYAALYRVRVASLVNVRTTRDPETEHALEEAARHLALWMTYEDIPRVAELKTRPTRFEGIRVEAKMAPDQILVVSEQMKPGLEEIAAMLPRRLGQRLMARHARGKSLPFVGRPISLKSTSIVGYAALRVMARMGSMRRGSLRFSEENAAIEAWLATLRMILERATTEPGARAFSAAWAELPRLRKGYSDTYTRGVANYNAIAEALTTEAALNDLTGGALRLRRAIAAAFADPEGIALKAVI